MHVNPGTVLVQARPEEFQNKVTKAEPNSFYVLNDNPVLEGGSINNPQQGYQSEGGGSGLPDVTFGFDSHGKAVFERVTKEIAKRGENAQLPGVTKPEALQHFAIVLDEQVITAPSIDYTQYPNGIDASNGSEITGGFTLTSAQNLADELQSGALPIKLEQISHSQVSATLGKTALNQGLLAMAVGLLVVCIFLLTFYRVLGIIAIGGLAIYSIYYFALIKAIPIVLTLPGIAGLILTIGIAADANIVIFERIKEEIRAGRSIPAGIAAGYKRGFAAIVDANVVTFMTAFILFALATAEVQGFAFTLGIGTLLSLFTAVLATQAALGSMGRSRVIGHPALLGAARAKRALRFDFMGASRWFFSLSGTILLDRRPGDRRQRDQLRHRLHLRHAHPDGLHPADLPGTDPHGAARTQPFQRPDPEAHRRQERRRQRLSDLAQAAQADPGGRRRGIAGQDQPAARRLRQLDRADLRGDGGQAAVIAIIASLIVISVYIALRFEWKYAVPVLIALMHDLLITAGVYALTGREVSSATVAALLTILGYSLYDTIIVFDRVRENVPRMPRAAFSQIVNRSMSEVLTRSLATSFCTLLPVLALLLFGGETLKNFAFALMVGIASGAYSSIFIASPVLTHWKEREGSYRNRRARLVRDFGLVPPYATALDGSPIDVEPAKQRRRQRKGGLLVAAEEPGEQVSQEEFEEMVRDLDIERERCQRSSHGVTGKGPWRPPPGTMPARRRAPKAPSSPKRLWSQRSAAGAGGRSHPRGSGAQGTAQTPETAAQQTSWEVALMGMLGWVMMGLAIWHFTIWLPDRFWGGIVGALIGSLIGAVVISTLIYSIKVSGLAIPGKKETDIAVVLFAVPGSLIGMAAVYLEGIRREGLRAAITSPSR